MPLEARDVNGMTIAEARRLLDLSRQARWAFPTSQGRPVHWETVEEWVPRLEKERDSFAKAVSFLIHDGHEDMALEIAANVWRLWVLARDDEGGRKFLATVLDEGSTKPTRWRALTLYGDSLFAHRQGNKEDSRRRSMEALEAARIVNDTEGLCLANLALSRVALDGPAEDLDDEKARRHASEARRLARGLGPEFGQAPLFMEATSYRMLGDYEKSASLFTQSLDLNRRIQDKGMVIAELTNLGLVEIHRNNVDFAEQCLNEAEKISTSKDFGAYGDGITLLNKAMIAFRRGNISQARSLLIKSKSTFEQAKLEPGRDDKFEIDWLSQEVAKIAHSHQSARDSMDS